jgi:hypothetical protein
MFIIPIALIFNPVQSLLSQTIYKSIKKTQELIYELASITDVCNRSSDFAMDAW